MTADPTHPSPFPSLPLPPFLCLSFFLPLTPYASAQQLFRCSVSVGPMLAEDLLRQRAFVKPADVAAALNTSPEAAAGQLEAAAAALASEGAQTLYCVAVLSDAHGKDQRVSLCCGRREAEKAKESAPYTAVSVFAAVLPSSRAAAALGKAGSAATPFLRPQRTVETRAYPLVTREALEKNVKTEPLVVRPVAAAPPLLARSPPCQPTAEAAASFPAESPQLHVAPTSSPSSENEEAPVTASEAGPVLPAEGQTPLAEAGAAPSSAVQKQASLFDMMKKSAAAAAADAARHHPPAPSAGATSRQKRPRAEKKADSDAVDSRNPASASTQAKSKAPKRAKVHKAETDKGSNSLAKLAKASARSRKAGEGVPAKSHSTPMHGFLDDEEADDNAGASVSSSVDYTNSAVADAVHGSAEASVLDVTVTVANDDIILCDDAPPLAFLEPAHAQTPQATVVQGSPSPTPAPASDARSTLTAFFNAEVIQFQRGYTRKLKTEVKKDANGEYMCVDVPYYEPVSGVGECLSEEAYHRRTADLARTQRGNNDSSATPSRQGEAGESAKEDDDDSPEAAQTKHRAAAGGKHGARPVAARVASQAEKAGPKPKTLLSFFKPLS